VWVRTAVGADTVVADTSNGGIWLESKVGEQGVLTWEGRDARDDPFANDG